MNLKYFVMQYHFEFPLDFTSSTTEDGFEGSRKQQFFLSVTASFKDHQPSCWQQFLFQWLSLAETSTRLLEMQNRPSQLRGCLPRQDGIISRETWQEHQVSIASSYQLHERDAEALEWAVGSAWQWRETDAHYRRGDGMRCFLPEPGESERFVFF